MDGAAETPRFHRRCINSTRTSMGGTLDGRAVAGARDRSTLLPTETSQPGGPMSLFGKPVEDASPSAPSDASSYGAYGIVDLVRLLKSIPIDHHPELVVQVIKTTLESVGVRSSAVIDDALIRENGMREAMEMLESQIVVLTQEIEARQYQIAQLKVELSETMHARGLLANAEPPFVPLIDLNLPQLAEPYDAVARDGAGSDDEHAAREPKSLPPPVPPPRRKAAVGRAPAS
jgi:hypothetical protein